MNTAGIGRTSVPSIHFLKLISVLPMISLSLTFLIRIRFSHAAVCYHPPRYREPHWIRLYSRMVVRAEESRVGNECVSKCSYRWSAYAEKNKYSVMSVSRFNGTIKQYHSSK